MSTPHHATTPATTTTNTSSTSHQNDFQEHIRLFDKRVKMLQEGDNRGKRGQSRKVLQQSVWRCHES
ncbi:MAG: hypothetical protein WBF57_17790, partial [Mycobacterium sp.]